LTTLVTERLLLRPLCAGDLEPLARVLAEPAVSRFWPAYDLERVRAEYFAEDEDDLVVFAIEHDGQAIGLVQYGEEDDPMYRHAGVDLFLRAADHGRGFAREALTAVIDHLFVERGHHRIVIDPAAHNARAIAVYEKLGFRRVGLLRQYERGPDGSFHDGVLLDLLASDWKKRANAAPAIAIDLRPAKPGDEPLLLPMMRDFNRGELIEIEDDVLERALSKLLADPALGVIWLFEAGGEVAGYTVFTFGYDLEFAGRDAIVTEFYVKTQHRRRGVAHAALAEIDRAARALGVGAIHLGVRPDNAAAFRLYEGAGYSTSRHVFLTKLLQG
jgi:aminoglycoside 6'-N-acetyltransferase